MCRLGGYDGIHDDGGRIEPMQCVWLVLGNRAVKVGGGMLLLLLLLLMMSSSSLFRLDGGLGFIQGMVWKVVPIGADFRGGGVDDNEGGVDTKGKGDLVGICGAEFLHARVGDDERERKPALRVDVVVEMGVVREVGGGEIEFDLADRGEDLHDWVWRFRNWGGMVERRGAGSGWELMI